MWYAKGVMTFADTVFSIQISCQYRVQQPFCGCMYSSPWKVESKPSTAKKQAFIIYSQDPKPSSVHVQLILQVFLPYSDDHHPHSVQSNQAHCYMTFTPKAGC